MITRRAMRVFEGYGQPELLLAHATGFCKEIWEPFIDDLRAAGIPNPVRTWDFTGHGDGPPARLPLPWTSIAREVHAMAEASTPHPVLVGHSMGAAAAILAEVTKPGMFSGLVLIEPVMFPPPHRRRDHLVAQVAEGRKRSFRDGSEARRNFEGPFGSWDGRALAAYLRGGFRRENGELILKCLPEVEADLYRESFAHDAFDRLEMLSVSVLLIVGDRSEIYPPSYLDEVKARMPQAEVRTLRTGHLVPMEDPRELARAVAEWLARL